MYWEEFYKNRKHTNKQSNFANFVLLRLPKTPQRILDIGCGNGKDSYFFASHNHEVVGVDMATENESKENCFFEKGDVIKYIDNPTYDYDIVYSRFFFHSLHDNQIESILKKIKKGAYLMAEFRTEEDKIFDKTFGKDHFRNYINVDDFIKNYGDLFHLEYLFKGRGMAKFKQEDPFVARIIAKIK